MQTIPQRTPIGDRFGSTLFLAALVHGVIILGVTFTAGSLVNPTLPSLNVTLVADTGRDEDVDDADFLANRDQRRAGRAAPGTRPTTTLAADEPTTQTGDPYGADLEDGTPREATPSAEQLVSRGQSDNRVSATPQPTDAAAPMPQRAAALLRHVVPRTTAIELSLRAELPSQKDDSRTLLATPSTQASGLAEYLDAWRRRVERIGTANYPRELLGDEAQGRPTLEVVIRADGRLDDIIVRRSSGDQALDQAALKILRLAAPFDPLPENLRADYDVLRFAYEWDFFQNARADARP